MITSVSHNPKSCAKYARHRATWKGRTQQLLYEIEYLKAENRPIFYALHNTWGDVMMSLQKQGVELPKVTIIKHGLEHVGLKFQVTGTAPQKWRDLVDDELRGDLPL